MMLPEWLTTVAWIALSVGFACTLIIAADIFLLGYRLSTACSANAGAGLTTGTAGWVTVTLAPGKYELLCNVAGHYQAACTPNFWPPEVAHGILPRRALRPADCRAKDDSGIRLNCRRA